MKLTKIAATFSVMLCACAGNLHAENGLIEEGSPFVLADPPDADNQPRINTEHEVVNEEVEPDDTRVTSSWRNPVLNYRGQRRRIDVCEAFEGGPNYPLKCGIQHSRATMQNLCAAAGYRTWVKGSWASYSVRPNWIFGSTDYTPFYFIRSHEGGELVTYLECTN